MSTDDLIHDREAIRNAADDDADRLVRRVSAALQAPGTKAVMQVVLDETDALRHERDEARRLLAEAQAFLEQRSEALNRTGRQNDELRAKVERVRALAADWANGRAPTAAVELRAALGES